MPTLIDIIPLLWLLSPQLSLFIAAHLFSMGWNNGVYLYFIFLKMLHKFFVKTFRVATSSTFHGLGKFFGLEYMLISFIFYYNKRFFAVSLESYEPSSYKYWCILQYNSANTGSFTNIFKWSTGISFIFIILEVCQAC